MKDGYIKVAAAYPDTVVADVPHHTKAICDSIAQAEGLGVHLLVLPELCVTGFTCGDLFRTRTLQDGVAEALSAIKTFTAGKTVLTVLGAPVSFRGKLYDCAVAVQDGHILAAVPRTAANGTRPFAKAVDGQTVTLCSEVVPFGTDIVLQHDEIAAWCLGMEIGEDLALASEPAARQAACGATVIANCSATEAFIGQDERLKLLAASASARLRCGYVCANAGAGESTQDSVWTGHHLIAEMGKVLAENEPFAQGKMTVTELDVQAITARRQQDDFFENDADSSVRTVMFHQDVTETKLTRHYAPNPFVPEDEAEMDRRAAKILSIQAHALAKRLTHAWAKTAVVGISGGLDSCLALLVMVHAMDLLNRPRTDVVAVTMPCFGTTHRTRSNAEMMCEELGVTFRTVEIGKSVMQHFEDIGHDPQQHDVTFENAQARERTQVLMDIANQTGGMVVGTGDLSELALGWATYNGDHMSMYGVNASIPKTLIRKVVAYEAKKASGKLPEVLTDILNTPVSPELLPADNEGKISQKTEDLVGPYELHDFFLYYFIRFGFAPEKLFRMAKYVFAGVYNDDTIHHWLKTFMRRFFIQQYKRSCVPDGPKVGTVDLSPRTDWRMPSDASYALWLKDL